jgi:hypothetical protein
VLSSNDVEIASGRHQATAHAKESVKALIRKLRFRRFSTVQSLIVLAVLFVGATFAEEIEAGALLYRFLFSLAFVSAVLAIAARRRVLVIAIVRGLRAGGGLGRHYFCFKMRALASGNGSDDRASSCGCPDCTPCRP